MKKHLPNIILTIVFMTGLSLLLYPSISDYWNSYHQSRAIAEYADLVSKIDDDEYERIWQEAEEYNKRLLNKSNRLVPLKSEHEEYLQTLNVNNYGIMGYLEIPSINCSLTIYHGTDEAVLQIAVGHLEGTSLPVGGESTHCVMSGHRGLPSAKLLSNLDKVEVGEIFLIRTLDECLTYEVDQIRIVEPHEISELDIVEGEDYCTLVTCTPYGINSHRLLVRGHRVENREDSERIRVTADAIQIDPIMVVPFVAAPMLIALIGHMFFGHGKKKGRGKRNET